MTRTAKFATLGVIIAVAIVMSSIALGQITAAREYTAESLSEIQETEGYVLKNCSGFVGVYYHNTGYPAYITDIPIKGLRRTDQATIQNGYTVNSREELMQVLEDLSS